MTRTELKQLTEICTCGHPATDHKFTRIAGGCTHNGNCSCIAYRTFDVRVPTGVDLARELEHWAHHVGNPPNTPQMTAEQLAGAYATEQEFQKPYLLEREVEHLERAIRQSEWQIETEQRELERERQRLIELRAQLPEAKESAMTARVAA